MASGVLFCDRGEADEVLAACPLPSNTSAGDGPGMEPSVTSLANWRPSKGAMCNIEPCPGQLIEQPEAPSLGYT